MSSDISYIYKTSARARSIRIKVEAPGTITVTSPPFTPGFMVKAFVKLQQNWIERTLERFIQTSTTPRAHTTDSVLIFGKRYTKKLAFSKTNPIGVTIQGDQLLINPVDQRAATTNQVLRFLKNTAAHYLTNRVAQLAKEMRTTYGTLTLRQQKTRWGSCSSAGNLNFNWKLIHFEPPIIDYVIIHELAHRTHMNHSARFWQLVERYDPEYRLHRGFLKRQGMMVG